MVSCRNPAATRVDEDLKFIFVPQLSLHLRYFDYSIGCYPLGKNATSVRRAPIFTRGLRYSVKRA